MAHIVCPHCGKRTEGDSRLCTQCGTPLNSADKGATPPPKRRAGRIVVIVVIGLAVIALLAWIAISMLIGDRNNPTGDTFYEYEQVVSSSSAAPSSDDSSTSPSSSPLS